MSLHTIYYTMFLGCLCVHCFVLKDVCVECFLSIQTSHRLWTWVYL